MINLKKATELMDNINKNGEYNCFFEGRGNGEVSFIVEEKVIRIDEHI
jgi:hypothetical protein